MNEEEQLDALREEVSDVRQQYEELSGDLYKTLEVLDQMSYVMEVQAAQIAMLRSVCGVEP